ERGGAPGARLHRGGAARLAYGGGLYPYPHLRRLPHERPPGGGAANLLYGHPGTGGAAPGGRRKERKRLSMDKLVRAITADGMVQAVAVSTRDLTERARQIHTTLPVATAALGRTLAAASMMGNALKVEEASLTLQIKG